jgi:hypothetical protein
MNIKGLTKKLSPYTINDTVVSKSSGVDKYDVSQLSYPIDLVSADQYGGNMVVFYINVATASKFLSKLGPTVDMSGMDTPRIRGLGVARDISTLNMAASSIIGGALPGLVVGGFAGFGSLVGGASVIGGASFWAAGDIAGTTTREQKRLKSAIALHMPNNLSIRYSASWAEEDTASAEMASVLGQDAVGMMKSLQDVDTKNMTSVDGAIGEGKKVVGKTGGDIKGIAASIALANAPNAGAVSNRTGLAANPRKEMVFKGTEFRTFSFDYNFFPRSSDEAKNVEKIINTFKFHMHPEFKDANSFLYLYPSEFDITYFTRDGENRHIHRHASCVLTEMSINYTPNGNFSVFDDGMPTQIQVTLAFKELQNPTKETIQLGL